MVINMDPFSCHVFLETLDLKRLVGTVLPRIEKSLTDPDSRVKLARQLKSALHKDLHDSNSQSLCTVLSEFQREEKEDAEQNLFNNDKQEPGPALLPIQSNSILSHFDLWEPILHYALEWPHSYTTLRLVSKRFRDLCDTAPVCWANHAIQLQRNDLSFLRLAPVWGRAGLKSVRLPEGLLLEQEEGLLRGYERIRSLSNFNFSKMNDDLNFDDDSEVYEIRTNAKDMMMSIMYEQSQVQNLPLEDSAQGNTQNQSQYQQNQNQQILKLELLVDLHALSMRMKSSSSKNISNPESHVEFNDSSKFNDVFTNYLKQRGVLNLNQHWIAKPDELNHTESQSESITVTDDHILQLFFKTPTIEDNSNVINSNTPTPQNSTMGNVTGLGQNNVTNQNLTNSNNWLTQSLIADNSQNTPQNQTSADVDNPNTTTVADALLKHVKDLTIQGVGPISLPSQQLQSSTQTNTTNAAAVKISQNTFNAPLPTHIRDQLPFLTNSFALPSSSENIELPTPRRCTACRKQIQENQGQVSDQIQLSSDSHIKGFGVLVGAQRLRRKTVLEIIRINQQQNNNQQQENNLNLINFSNNITVTGSAIAGSGSANILNQHLTQTPNNNIIAQGENPTTVTTVSSSSSSSAAAEAECSSAESSDSLSPENSNGKSKTQSQSVTKTQPKLKVSDTKEPSSESTNPSSNQPVLPLLGQNNCRSSDLSNPDPVQQLVQTPQLSLSITNILRFRILLKTWSPGSRLDIGVTSSCPFVRSSNGQVSNTGFNKNVTQTVTGRCGPFAPGVPNITRFTDINGPSQININNSDINIQTQNLNRNPNFQNFNNSMNPGNPNSTSSITNTAPQTVTLPARSPLTSTWASSAFHSKHIRFAEDLDSCWIIESNGLLVGSHPGVRRHNYKGGSSVSESGSGSERWNAKQLLRELDVIECRVYLSSGDLEIRLHRGNHVSNCNSREESDNDSLLIYTWAAKIRKNVSTLYPVIDLFEPDLGPLGQKLKIELLQD